MIVSRVTVYTKDGVRLTELDTSARYTYKMNAYGEGALSMAFSDFKTTRKFLVPGNLIVIEGNFLPIWGGVIDVPITWSWSDKCVKIACYSAEYLLTFARLPKTLKIDGTPGTIFKELIQNTHINAHILTNAVSGDGEDLKLEYHFDSAYDAITTLCSDADMEFDILPRIDDNGILVFETNLYNKRGKGIDSPFKLLEGKNINLTDEPLVEDGPIYNDVIGYGDGSTWNSRHVTDPQTDEASLGLYGIRQIAQPVDQSKKADIVKATQTFLKDSKNPIKKFDLELNNSDNTFSWMGIGNRYDAEFYSIGFKDDSTLGLSVSVRLLGMTYDDKDKKLAVVMEEDNGA